MRQTLMAADSRILSGCGLATTRRKPCSPSCLKVKPFSRVSLHRVAAFLRLKCVSPLSYIMHAAVSAYLILLCQQNFTVAMTWQDTQNAILLWLRLPLWPLWLWSSAS